MSSIGTESTGWGGSTTDEAKAQASTLADATREEAGSVAQEARTQARNVMDDARTMVDDQTRSQRDRVVETARSFSGDLEQMADAGPDGLAGDVARQVAEKLRSISERVDGREPNDLLEDVRDFARRRPGLFLLGALGAGVVVGRMARGAKDAQNGSTMSTPRSTTATTRTSSFTSVEGIAVPDSGLGSRTQGDPLSSTNEPYDPSHTRVGDEAGRSR